MQMRLPIGEDDFAQVRREYYFVDKSVFVADFLRHHAAVTLFTRPRRFGKTLTLSMLRYFLDLWQSEQHRELFAGLAIEQDAAAMQQYGQRPVVYLTFRELKLNSWQRMEQGLRRCLSVLFRQYRFLLDAPDMDTADRVDFEQIRMGTADLVTEMGSLALLLRLLEQHYGRKAVLLIDEYDVPVQQGWQYGFYDSVIEFMRVLLTTALKSNPSLDFAVLTGVLRIAKESIFSDLNNLQVDSMLHTKYPSAFGFTPEEVRRIARDFAKEEKLPELRAWYDGYRLESQEIYNPWSVLQYFAQGCRPGPYWVNTSGNAILSAMMQTIDAEHTAVLQGLLQGGTVQAYLREGVIYDDIADDDDALYTMLVTTGYLTATGQQEKSGEQEYTLRLPNREMQNLFAAEILKRLQVHKNKSALVQLMGAFLPAED